MRILYVEDHQLFARTVIAQFLAAHDVTLCCSIACAEALLKSSPESELSFDLVLVDYDLPDGKGDALVRSMRRSGFRGVILAVSAHEDGNLRLYRAGADGICRKADFHRIAEAIAAAQGTRR